jgi:hypothetical protein
LLYSCHLLFSLVFQIIWIGKNFKHSKIIIYVGSTVCEGGGGGQEVILTLLICEGAGEGGGAGRHGGEDVGLGGNRGEHVGFGPTPQRIYICCY